jgi:transposase
VPRTLVWDGEGAIGRWRAGRVELTGDCQAFRGTLGTKVVICRPADPEAKGIIERAHDYLERSFLPGRTFASPADFNAQLQAWLPAANGRHRRVLGCTPADRIAADRAAMLPLPPVGPATGWRTSVRLPRDHYVRLDSNDYSVHPGVIGRRVEVVANLDRVRVVCDGRGVADHVRSWARHQSFTDPAHAQAAAALRRQHHALTPVPALVRTGGSIPVEVQVEQRPLASYDAALGLLDGQPDEHAPQELEEHQTCRALAPARQATGAAR